MQLGWVCFVMMGPAEDMEDDPLSTTSCHGRGPHQFLWLLRRGGLLVPTTQTTCLAYLVWKSPFSVSAISHLSPEATMNFFMKLSCHFCAFFFTTPRMNMGKLSLFTGRSCVSWNFASTSGPAPVIPSIFPRILSPWGGNCERRASPYNDYRILFTRSEFWNVVLFIFHTPFEKDMIIFREMEHIAGFFSQILTAAIPDCSPPKE